MPPPPQGFFRIIKNQEGGGDPYTPTTGLRERGNDTSKSTGRSGRQKVATRRNMRREERVTVQGPVKEQQPDGMSHRGDPSPKTPSPPPQTKVTIVGKNEIYNRENLVRPFLVHQVLGPKAPPPLPPPLLKRSPAPPRLQALRIVEAQLHALDKQAYPVFKLAYTWRSELSFVRSAFHSNRDRWEALRAKGPEGAAKALRPYRYLPMDRDESERPPAPATPVRATPPGSPGSSGSPAKDRRRKKKGATFSTAIAESAV